MPHPHKFAAIPPKKKKFNFFPLKGVGTVPISSCTKLATTAGVIPKLIGLLKGELSNVYSSIA